MFKWFGYFTLASLRKYYNEKRTLPNLDIQVMCETEKF